MNIRTRLALSAVVLAGIGLAAALPAAASNHKTTTTTHPKRKKAAAKGITTAAAGKQYLALVAPVNATLSAFGTEANGWTDSTTNAQAEADAQPAISALNSLDGKLLSDKWPAADETDIKSLVTNIAPVTGDLQGLSSVNLLNGSSWEATFQRDASNFSAAVAIVRHDLGLPAAAK